MNIYILSRQENNNYEVTARDLLSSLKGPLLSTYPRRIVSAAENIPENTAELDKLIAGVMDDLRVTSFSPIQVRIRSPSGERDYNIGVGPVKDTVGHVYKTLDRHLTCLEAGQYRLVWLDGSRQRVPLEDMGRMLQDVGVRESTVMFMEIVNKWNGINISMAVVSFRVIVVH